MNILVIGKGGREHALAKALQQSKTVNSVYVLPGNEAIDSEIPCILNISSEDFEKVYEVVKEKSIDLVIVGPEKELVSGMVDFMEERSIPIVGPKKEMAQLEGSKIFAKDFMKSAGVPTAFYKLVSSSSEVNSHISSFQPPYVLKADGLCGGKGVFICKDEKELSQASHLFFEKKIFGSSGERALLEAYQEGWELSYLILTDGKKYEKLLLSQDHKPLLEGNKGSNTGGMGVVCPLKLDDSLDQKISKEILDPLMKEMKKRGADYKGVLYLGLMITEEGPQVLEFNVRFGDPEAQAILPLFSGDWGEVFYELAKGNLIPLKWKKESSACVVLAAQGYPEKPVKGTPIKGDIKHKTEKSYFLYPGIKKNQKGEWVVDGGRAVNSVGLGSDMEEAISKAYEQARTISWDKMQMRRDIGKFLKS